MLFRPPSLSESWETEASVSDASCTVLYELKEAVAPHGRGISSAKNGLGRRTSCTASACSRLCGGATADSAQVCLFQPRVVITLTCLDRFQLLGKWLVEWHWQFRAKRHTYSQALECFEQCRSKCSWTANSCGSELGRRSKRGESLLAMRRPQSAQCVCSKRVREPANRGSSYWQRSKAQLRADG